MSHQLIKLNDLLQKEIKIFNELISKRKFFNNYRLEIGF